MGALSEFDRRRYFTFLMLFFVVHGVGSTLFGALAPRLSEAFGLTDGSLALVPVAMAAGGITGAVVGATMGKVTRLRRTLQWLVGALSAIFALLSMAPSYAVFLAISFCTPLIATIVATLSHGLVGRISERGKTAGPLARVEASYAGGTTLGPFVITGVLALAAAMAASEPWRWPYAAVSVGMAGLVLWSLRLPSLSAAGVSLGGGPGLPALRDALRVRMVLLMAASGLCFGAVELSHGAWVVLYGVKALGLSGDAARVGLGLFTGGMLLARIFMAAITRRMPAERLIIWSATMSVAATLWMTQAQGELSFYIINAALGVAAGVFFPISLLIALERRPDIGNALSGVLIIAANLGYQVVGYSVGALAESIGFRSAYWIVAAAAAAWLVLSIFYAAAARRFDAGETNERG